VLKAFDPPFITGFTRPIYSRNLVEIRITLQLMKLRFSLTMNNTGCTLLSIPIQTILLHTKLEQIRTNVTADQFFAELRKKHDVDDATFLVDGVVPLYRSCEKHGFGFRYERHGDRNSVERVFDEVKRRTTRFSNCFSNAEAETTDEWLRSFAFAWNQLV